MLKAKQKLLIWPEVRTRGETVVQDYGVETLNRDGQPLEKKGDYYYYYSIADDASFRAGEEEPRLVGGAAVLRVAVQGETGRHCRRDRSASTPLVPRNSHRSASHSGCADTAGTVISNSNK